MKLKDYDLLPVRKRRRMFEKATKLWEILEIALSEMYLIERNPLYKINMGLWYQKESFFNLKTNEWRQEKVCGVCLAGAVMAGCWPNYSKKVYNNDGALSPSDFKEFDAAEQKFQALDNLRCGNVWLARCSLGHRCDIELKIFNLNRFIIPYSNDKKKWWKQIKQLLKDLKKADV